MTFMQNLIFKGILSNQTGQDSLEYVALGLVVLLVSAIAVANIRNLVTNKESLIQSNYLQ